MWELIRCKTAPETQTSWSEEENLLEWAFGEWFLEWLGLSWPSIYTKRASPASFSRHGHTLLYPGVAAEQREHEASHVASPH